MFNPLHSATAFHRYLDRPTPEWERLLRYLPLVGSPIMNLLQSIRFQPVVRRIEDELRRRRRPELLVWSGDIEKALFAQSICELAMLEMGWPNDHFLPSDPACVAFWNHRDGLDFAATLKDIEDNFSIKLEAQDIQHWFGQTLGDVVDDLWNIKNAIESDME